MRFRLTYWSGRVEEFTLDNLPVHLSRRDASTMDMSWFVDGHMKRMKVGDEIKMDFDNVLTRVE